MLSDECEISLWLKVCKTLGVGEEEGIAETLFTQEMQTCLHIVSSYDDHVVSKFE